MNGENGRGAAALRVINGGMAALCGVMALVPTLMVAGLIALQVSLATHWPRGGFSWSLGGWARAHVDPGMVTVNWSECAVTAGRSVCHPMRSIHPAPLPTLGEDGIGFLSYLMLIIPLAALSYGLVQAGLCFVGLARGRWFERRTITHLRNFALGGLVYLVLSPAAAALANGADELLSRVLLHQNVSSNYHFDLSGLPTLLTVTYAVLLAVITAVLAHARKAADDHAQIV